LWDWIIYVHHANMLHNVKCGRLNQWEGSVNCNVEKQTGELLLVLIWHQCKRMQFEDVAIYSGNEL